MVTRNRLLSEDRGNSSKEGREIGQYGLCVEAGRVGVQMRLQSVFRPEHSGSLPFPIPYFFLSLIRKAFEEKDL